MTGTVDERYSALFLFLSQRNRLNSNYLQTATWQKIGRVRGEGGFIYKHKKIDRIYMPFLFPISLIKNLFPCLSPSKNNRSLNTLRGITTDITTRNLPRMMLSPRELNHLGTEEDVRDRECSTQLHGQIYCYHPQCQSLDSAHCTSHITQYLQYKKSSRIYIIFRAEK